MGYHGSCSNTETPGCCCVKSTCTYTRTSSDGTSRLDAGDQRLAVEAGVNRDGLISCQVDDAAVAELQDSRTGGGGYHARAVGNIGVFHQIAQGVALANRDEALDALGDANDRGRSLSHGGRAYKSCQQKCKSKFRHTFPFKSNQMLPEYE